MQGIQPPVLADRGLEGAVRALALDIAVPVTVTGGLAGRAPAPVESAAYFTAAECLANVIKHSSATAARVDLRHEAGVLSVVVGDNGAGGASIDGGTGLRGVVRRLESFDGDNRRVLAVLRYLQNTATPSPLYVTGPGHSCLTFRWRGGRREAVRGRGEARRPGGIGYGRRPAARPQLAVRSHQYATSGPR